MVLSLVSIYSKLYDHDTKKQSDKVVEQSSFPLIALFWLKIGRCRGQNWFYRKQAFSQLRPRQRPISSQNKATSLKDDCSTTKSLCFCVVVVEFAVNGNQAFGHMVKLRCDFTEAQ